MTALNFVQPADKLGFYTPASANPVFTEAEIIYREIFRRNIYLRHVDQIRAPGFVIDAGANIGLFTIFINQTFPQARVLAIEPIPTNAKALRANIELHGIQGVTVHQGGLSNRHEVREFYYFPSMPGNSTAHPDEKLRDREVMAGYAGRKAAEQVFRHERVVAPVTRLSDILAEVAYSGEVDLVKMDIEGDEVDALQGIDESDWPRIAQFVMEVHMARTQLPIVLDVLQSHGFTTEVDTDPDLPDGIDNKMVYARQMSLL